MGGGVRAPRPAPTASAHATPSTRADPAGIVAGMQPITELAPNEVFVFGSNADGAHAAGAARTAAERFGAVWGEGDGLHGRSYAIDTMSGAAVMADRVESFLRFASEHPELRFLVTPIGTGIAGYQPHEVAPLFAAAPDNVVLPPEFADLR